MPWRSVQIGSSVLILGLALLAIAGLVSVALALALSFFFLAAFFFADFASSRRGSSLFGSDVSLIGTYGSLVIVLALVVNILAT